MPTDHTDKTTADAPYRDTTIIVGIDADGRHHVYRTPDEQIHIVDPATGHRTHVEGLEPDDSVEIGYAMAVARGCGWADLWFGCLAPHNGIPEGCA